MYLQTYVHAHTNTHTHTYVQTLITFTVHGYNLHRINQRNESLKSRKEERPRELDRSRTMTDDKVRMKEDGHRLNPRIKRRGWGRIKRRRWRIVILIGVHRRRHLVDVARRPDDGRSFRQPLEVNRRGRQCCHLHSQNTKSD